MDLMNDESNSNGYWNEKPCGCIGIRICLECVESIPVNSDEQAVEGDGYRCNFSFETMPAEFLSSIDFPVHDSSDDEAPRSCKVINNGEPFPDINAPKFSWYQLLRPGNRVAANEKIGTADKEAGKDAQKIPKKEGRVEKYHSKKENRETRSTTSKTDKYAMYKSRHKSKKKIEKRRKRHSSYSTSDDSSESDYSKELKKYRKDQQAQKKSSGVLSGSAKVMNSLKPGSPLRTVRKDAVQGSKELKYRKDQQAQKKDSKVLSGSTKLMNSFQPGSPLRTVSNDVVQGLELPVENKTNYQVELTPNASSAAQATDVIMEVIAANSEGGITDPKDDITDPKDDISTCDLPPSFQGPEEEISTCELPPSLQIQKEECAPKKPGTAALNILKNYSSHSEEEESSHQLPCHRNESKKSRRRSPDRESEYGRDYRRSRRRSESMEDDRTTVYDEEYSNYGGYEDDGQTYYCEHCLKTMNSLQTWESHISGKKHLKAVKLANPDLVASESSMQLNADFSRKLRIKAPPAGYTRERRFRHSKIESALDDAVKQGAVLVGLSEVMELNLPQKDLSYYCCLCEAICQPISIRGHLLSFRHKLNYLKTRNIKFYDSVSIQKKYAAEPRVNSYFRQMRESCGEIQVFEDIPIKHYNDHNLPGPSREYPRHFSDTASVMSDYSIAETIDPSLRDVEPETSKGDYFCKVCNSHMNSSNMWLSHITGKRHMKNVKKAPGEAPSKVKFIKSDIRARLYKTIREWESVEENRNVIICGLDYICERQLENGRELYNCYLCHSNCTPIEIIDHLTSLKHMRKYIEKEDPEKAENLTQITNSMSNYGINSLHFDACVSLVEKKGKGKIEVLVPRK